MVLKVISGHDKKDPFSVSETVPDYLKATKERKKLKIAASSLGMLSQIKKYSKLLMKL